MDHTNAFGAGVESRWINPADEREVAQWCARLQCSAAELAAAVSVVGHLAVDVQQYVQDRQRAGSGGGRDDALVPRPNRVIAIGSSTGGVSSLRQLVASLPTDFEAPILIVQHTGEFPSILPKLLTSAGPLLAQHGRDGERLVPGRIYVAPPDQHMLVDGSSLQALGHPSTFVCPECKGTLWEIAGSRPLRFRCHTGHAYTDRTLDHAQSEGTDAALWGALRALQEKRLLLECRAGAQEREGEVDDAARLHAAAQMLGEQVDLLRTWVQERQSPVEADV